MSDIDRQMSIVMRTLRLRRRRLPMFRKQRHALADLIDDLSTDLARSRAKVATYEQAFPSGGPPYFVVTGDEYRKLNQQPGGAGEEEE